MMHYNERLPRTPEQIAASGVSTIEEMAVVNARTSAQALRVGAMLMGVCEQLANEEKAARQEAGQPARGAG